MRRFHRNFESIAKIVERNGTQYPRDCFPHNAANGKMEVKAKEERRLRFSAPFFPSRWTIVIFPVLFLVSSGCPILYQVSSGDKTNFKMEKNNKTFLLHVSRYQETSPLSVETAKANSHSVDTYCAPPCLSERSPNPSCLLISQLHIEIENNSKNKEEEKRIVKRIKTSHSLWCTKKRRAEC